MARSNRQSAKVPDAFVGRKTEPARLEQFLAAPQSRIAVVHGRRCAGKTSLIDQALQGRDFLRFDGVAGAPRREQISHFMGRLHVLTGAVAKKAKGWEDALMQLYGVLKDKPRPLLFDEFQWMADHRRDLVSILKSVWDDFLSRLPGQKLVLCGSTASFMVEKVIKSSALYGRILLRFDVGPFKLSETRQMLPGRGVDEILQAQMLTGGIPLYLELLRDMPSIMLGLRQMAFEKGGCFTDEYDRIFLSHFGSDPGFEAIVTALVEKPMGLMRGALADRTGLPLGGRLTEHLRDLESAGFVSSERPFNRGMDTRKTRYRLTDPYLRFYLEFIRPNLARIQGGQGAAILSGLSGSGALNSWMGHSFVQMCTQHALEIAQLAGFPAVDHNMGPYFVPHRQGSPGLEVDLVFDRADNVLTVCEMKYSSHPVGIEAIGAMKPKIRLLQPVAEGRTISPCSLFIRGPPRQCMTRRISTRSSRPVS